MNSANYWILANYYFLEIELEKNLKTFELSHNVSALYRFLWDSYANCYVEYLKIAPKVENDFGKSLFKQFVITASSYCPFETEVLWEEFFGEKTTLSGYCKDANWSKNALNIYFEKYDLESIKEDQRYNEFESVISFLQQMRSIRGLFGIDPAINIEVFSKNKILQSYSEYIKLIAKIDLNSSDISGLYQSTSNSISYQIDILTYIKDKSKEITRTNKLIDSLSKQIIALESQLNNKKFVENAEEDIISQKKLDLEQRLKEKNQQLEKLEYIQKN